MTLQQQQAYYRWQQMRQQALYRQVQNARQIQTIRAMIARGVNPVEDPAVAPVYYALVGEYGEGIFKFDDKGDDAILTTEEERN